jgi:hypothetical protein
LHRVARRDPRTLWETRVCQDRAST